MNGKCSTCGTIETTIVEVDGEEYLMCKNGHLVGKVMARTAKVNGRTKVY